ncbi:hypothetical protein DOTSEDRAFT_21090 [Dothistroma septosporum NZE10]|uniref:Uncharacterized protein n=1 Tax=Dothistroma septosporum (strain NZE10 / CBS 128990) TaxID=675120 RepID=N1PY19_DOTSN|nr:hypothetical protein DOTSEDRAFT_21090 [Dothistroma septosporum NZE10]
MEHIIDRSELLSEHSPPPSSPSLEDMKRLGNFEYVAQKRDVLAADVNGNDDELDFVLFAPSDKKLHPSRAVAKIRIQTPPPDDKDPGFVVPTRPEAYYFRGRLSTEQQQKFEAVALTGEDVLMRSHSLVPGYHYAWKVRHIAMSQRQSRALEEHARTITIGSVPNHKRPGKKARVKTRTMLEASKAFQEQQQKANELKEAAEREKRTRRNREKKAKKKQREKAKKAEGQAGDVVMEEDSGTD